MKIPLARNGKGARVRQRTKRARRVIRKKGRAQRRHTKRSGVSIRYAYSPSVKSRMAPIAFRARAELGAGIDSPVGADTFADAGP